MKLNTASVAILFALIITSTGCDKNGGFNLFSIEDDRNLGLQVNGEIQNDPNFNILNPNDYPDAYNYLWAMRDDILNSGNVTHKDDFLWETYIIHDDETLNAFATPGGYMYVYTGLIKYLDDASSLAGVMGHEIAHADRRHSTEQLTKIYGVQTLVSVALGQNQGLASDIAQQLIFLKFSRNAETEADNYSVEYLCPTKYHADGAANFFQKIIDDGSATPPEFLSTHPSPDNRVENIQSMASQSSCSHTISDSEDDADYAAFKASLPQ